MYHVGADVHQYTSSLRVLDDQGNCVKDITMRKHWTKMPEILEQIPKPFAVCFEASTGYGALYEMFSRHAERVAVAHPGHLRLIFRSKRKNDRVDAGKLALLLRLGEVPEIHVPDAKMRQWRRMIGLRHRMVADRTRTKNRIHSLLRQHGIEAIKPLWSRKGVDWLKALQLPLEEAAIERELLLDDLEQDNLRIKRMEKALDRMGKSHPAVVLLCTIPGVGIRTAEAFVAWVDQPQRFQGDKVIGSYFGLVPRQDASAAVNHLGHITKQGPAIMRKLLVEAAWQIVRRDDGMRELFLRIQNGDKDRNRIAIVAVAHQLAKVMLAILKRGTGYRKAAQAA